MESFTITRRRYRYQCEQLDEERWRVTFVGGPYDGESYVVDRDPRKVCLARKADGSGLCEHWHEQETQRCKFHGGRSLRGPDHPGYTHGGWSLIHSYLPGKLAKISEDLRAMPIDSLEEEILTARAMLRGYLELLDDDEAILEDGNLANLDKMLGRIEKLVGRHVQMRNSTAITAAELEVLKHKLLGIMLKYVPIQDQDQVIQEWMATFGVGDKAALPRPQDLLDDDD